MHRRALLSAATASALLATPALHAQEFNQTVRIIVPVAPGGTSDLLARLIAPLLSQRIGQTVVVENRAGAGGNVGADFVAKSRPDGHNILLLDISVLATNPSLYARMPFDVERELAAVQTLIFAPYLLVVNNALPVQDAAGLVAWVKANPGRLNVANAGIGTLSHIVGLSLAAHWQTEVVSIAYRGGAPAMMALVSNEANLSMAGLTLSLPFVQRGQMRGIAVTGPRRQEAVPNLPTFREMGWPVADVGTWQGVFVQGQTPRPVVERLEREIAAIMNETELRNRVAGLGAEVVVDGAEPLRRRLAEQTASYGEVIRRNNLRAE